MAFLRERIIGKAAAGAMGRTAGAAGAAVSRVRINIIITDKAAKDFEKATKSINEASKSGGLTSVVAVFTIMSLLGNSPAVEILGAFMEKWMAMFSGAIDWGSFIEIFEKLSPLIEGVMTLLGTGLGGAITLLGEKSEDGEGKINNLADAIEKLNKGLEAFLGWINAILGAVQPAYDPLDPSYKTPEYYYQGPAYDWAPGSWTEQGERNPWVEGPAYELEEALKKLLEG